jgi:type I restriction enzyme M protein
MPKLHDTQNEAYDYIKKELSQLGWIVKHPYKTFDGQVYNQNQCLDDPEIKKWLGKKHPEYIVKINETTLWIIEAEAERTKLRIAVDDAEKYYAARLNESSIYKVLFTSAIAGNDTDGYSIENKFFENGEYNPISLNEKKMTGLLSPQIIQRILQANSSSIKDIPVDPSFMKKADSINEILHKGAIPIEDRAKVMAALLLSTLEENPPNLNTDPVTLIKDINTRAEEALSRQGKAEFFQHMKLHLPTSRDNHGKNKKAMVDTLKELYNLNIKSLMNSSADVLGEFYEVFLKYGTWAQKMGIVFTPRHITRFAAEILDISINDIVFDPTCGTGGFLVAALDRIKQSYDKKQVDRFKQYSVFGIDHQASLVSLAIVNMIFRGDGKNNIIQGDCLAKSLVATTKHGIETVEYDGKRSNGNKNPGITKVLMNPSFHQESFDTKEFEFVKHALEQIVHGGLLFSVLPVGAMLRGGDKYEWRKNDLLLNNTLVAVITFPPDLFYPIGVHTLGVIVKKGVSHPKNQKVLWVKMNHDGYLKLKGRRLPDKKEPDDLLANRAFIKAFVHDQYFPVPDLLGVRKSAIIDFDDPQLELIPEAYLDSAYPNTDDVLRDLDNNIRNAAAFLIQNNLATHALSFGNHTGDAI